MHASMSYSICAYMHVCKWLQSHTVSTWTWLARRCVTQPKKLAGDVAQVSVGSIHQSSPCWHSPLSPTCASKQPGRSFSWLLSFAQGMSELDWQECTQGRPHPQGDVCQQFTKLPSIPSLHTLPGVLAHPPPLR